MLSVATQVKGLQGTQPADLQNLGAGEGRIILSFVFQYAAGSSLGTKPQVQFQSSVDLGRPSPYRLISCWETVRAFLGSTLPVPACPGPGRLT